MRDRMSARRVDDAIIVSISSRCGVSAIDVSLLSAFSSMVESIGRCGCGAHYGWRAIVLFDGQTIGQLTGEFVDGQTICQLTGEFVDGQARVNSLAFHVPLSLSLSRERWREIEMGYCL